MNLVRVGVNKQDKKPIYKELTYDFFVEYLGWEWSFTYDKLQIDFAWHKDKQKTICEATITDNGKSVTQCFESPEDLIENVRIDGLSLYDIWDKLNGVN